MAHKSPKTRLKDDLTAGKETQSSIPCDSSTDEYGDSEPTCAIDNSQKEIFFKEINFSPDLTIRIDYQVQILTHRNEPLFL